MDLRSQDSDASIVSAIQELAHHDAARRASARRVLITAGDMARTSIDQVISEVEDLQSIYYKELVRVRDWLRYGVDPRKLNRWLSDLDLIGVRHPNGIGGAIPALIHQPGFKALAS